jgi:hypothetical protein
LEIDILAWTQALGVEDNLLKDTHSRDLLGLMKMMECMEDEIPTHRKGEIGSEIAQKNQSGPRSGSKGCNKRKWD